VQNAIAHSNGAQRNFLILAAISLGCMAIGYGSNIPLLAGLPFVICGIAILLIDVRNVYFALLFFIPPSVNLLEWGFMSIDVPDEPLMLVLTVATPFVLLRNRTILSNRDLLRNNIVSIVSVFFLWAAICTITSTAPVVSAKFVMAKLWYILPFFFLTIAIVFDNPRILGKLLVLVLLSLIPMIILITIRHKALGFSFEHVNDATAPFWRNHVLYGSIMSMMIPLICAALWLTRRFTWKHTAEEHGQQ
jgi:O-antigen ligase